MSDRHHTHIKLGLLHSLHGTMAISERPLLDAEILAIEEINQSGGVLGRSLEPVIADGASDPEEFSRQARIMLDSGLTQLFGCWTSSSRKAVKDLLEERDALLWYPVQYEGLEESRNIIYTGSCLNQQITPALDWMLENLGKRICLLGSDYVFPLAAHKLVKAIIDHRSDGSSIVAETYIPLGGQDFAAAIEAIKNSRSEAVFNTLNGDSNIAFFRQYQAAGISSRDIPVLSVSIGESEIQGIAALTAGHYACWSYFQSLNNQENRQFIGSFKRRYGSDRVCSAPMVMAYTQIYLWKKAVELSQSFDVADIRRSLPQLELQGPAGCLKINNNHHMTQNCHIGKMLPDGQFAIVWSSPRPLAPLPWLGVEQCQVSNSELIKNTMAAFTDSIFYRTVLEQEIKEHKETADKLATIQEEALRTSEGRYSALFETMAQGVVY